MLGRGQGDLWAWGGSSRAEVGQGGARGTQDWNRTWGYHHRPRQSRHARDLYTAQKRGIDIAKAPQALNPASQVQSQGLADPLEKEMTTHSSILAWEIPWTEEHGQHSTKHLLVSG